jgi:hypothetical protein
MSKVGNVLDTIFKIPLEGKVNLNIEKIISFLFDEFNITRQTNDRKEWEVLKNKFFTKTTDCDRLQ